MNRRELMVAALAAPVLAMPLPALAASRRLIWGPGTYQNKHALMIARHCTQLMRDEIMYFSSEMDMSIKLTDPRFEIQMSQKVWNWMTGDTQEDAPKISIFERGVHIGDVGIGTSIGYEDYFQRENTDNYPDYFVRRLCSGYKEQKQWRNKLPDKHVEYDMRWMKHYINMNKENVV